MLLNKIGHLIIIYILLILKYIYIYIYIYIYLQCIIIYKNIYIIKLIDWNLYFIL